MAPIREVGLNPAAYERGEADDREAASLALDSSLARRTLGWRDRLTGDRLIARTADWYRAWMLGRDMRAFTLDQIAAYEALP
jgi:CDP-glucose 4,6-dehydratase